MKKKIALALLIVVILLGIGGVYAYFATSAFKTGKELFFSYMTSDLLSNLKDENLKEYIKKQENKVVQLQKFKMMAQYLMKHYK